MHMATNLKRWTLEELHRLPDDGNKYELVRGDLFVTPPPNDGHETILARLTAVLTRYVLAQQLGLIYHPRSVLRFEGSEVEPDLMVRMPAPGINNDWERAPRPILIVEVFSDSTRRRDEMDKRRLYADAAIDDYWMVDPEARALTVVRPGAPDHLVTDAFEWNPRTASAPLVIRLAEIFG